MARPLFSVRLPVDLAEALDRIAVHAGQSRSDVVETLLKGLDSDDRDNAVKTTVAGSPTRKMNLRLSTDALTRLKQLAPDLEPADFLRHALAYAIAMAPPEWHVPPPARGNADGSASARGRSRLHPDAADGVEVAAAAQAGSAGLALLAILLIGVLVTLVVWLIWRGTDPPPPGPGNDSGGQLPPGSTRTDAE